MDPGTDSALNLEAFVPGLALRKLAASPVARLEPMAEGLQCVVVFVDISGFTALTEHLAGLGARGVEEVREVLNACFVPLVDIVGEHGGWVEKFAGDATLAI